MYTEHTIRRSHDHAGGNWRPQISSRIKTKMKTIFDADPNVSLQHVGSQVWVLSYYRFEIYQKRTTVISIQAPNEPGSGYK